MKKVIVLAICLFAVSNVINAQEVPKKPKSETTESMKVEGKEHHEKKTPEQRTQKQLDELNTDVTLTEEQKPKIYDLVLVKVKKIDEIKAKYKGQPENKEVAKKEIDAVRKDFRQNLKSILTPAQIEKMKAKQKAEKENASEKD